MVSKEKMVVICVRIKLRDYASFEDLASDLGCEIEIQNIVNNQTPPPARRLNQGKRHPVTPELVHAIKIAKQNHPDFTYPQLRQLLENQNFRTSETVISYVLSGKYDDNGNRVRA